MSGGRGRASLRKVLLTLEVGLTVILLIGAGLLLKSYARLRSADMGRMTQDVITMHLGLPDARYGTPALRANFYDTLFVCLKPLGHPMYFRAIGIPILRGRTFYGGKRLDAANEVVISESFASQYFPSEDPLGRHLLVRGHNATIVRTAPAENYPQSSKLAFRENFRRVTVGVLVFAFEIEHSPIGATLSDHGEQAR